MRRIGFFAAFLLLLGLTTATAASFDVQAEDITSFSTPVSIDVPTRTAPLYLRGGGAIVPGSLSDTQPPNGRVNGKTLIADPTAVDEAHTDTNAYHAWETDSSGPAFVVGGSATVYLDQKNGTLMAALFECSPAYVATDGQPVEGAIADDDVVGRGCKLIAGPSGSGQSPGGYTEVSVPMSIPLTTIDAGNTLRLKVVNQASPPAPSMDLQWGYNPARSSQIAFGQ